MLVDPSGMAEWRRARPLSKARAAISVESPRQHESHRRSGQSVERSHERKGPIARTTHGRTEVICVTDIHPLVFWSSNRKTRIGKRARRVFQETEQGKHAIIVPIAVVEEISRLVEREVVHLEVPFRRWDEELERSPNFPIQACTRAAGFQTDLLKNFRGGSLLVT